VAASMTLWVNTITGKRLDRNALDDLRRKARHAYEANSHIFEDEYEALTALGAVPLNRLQDDTLEIAWPDQLASADGTAPAGLPQDRPSTEVRTFPAGRISPTG
jgi:hypothetical protein